MLRFKFPKNDARFAWTNHIKNKMLFYGISEQKVRSVFSSPKRKEEGIAPDTVAAMQSSRFKKKPEEIWVMYRLANSKAQIANRGKEDIHNKELSGVKKDDLRFAPRDLRSKILLISAWRYPGITKPGKKFEVPERILEELETEGLLH